MPVNTSGIYIPGKLKIEDATANSSDVLKDKIFYNNNGRQVGTYEEVLIGLKKDVIYSNQSATGSYESPDDFLNVREYDDTSMTSYEDISYGGSISNLKAYRVSGRILFAFINGAFLMTESFYYYTNMITIKDDYSFAAYIESETSRLPSVFYYKHDYSRLPSPIEIEIYYI